MSEADWILEVYEAGSIEYENGEDIESILINNGANPEGDTIISGLSHKQLVSSKKDILTYYKEKYFPSYDKFVSEEISTSLYTLLRDKLFPEVGIAEKELIDFLMQNGWNKCNNNGVEYRKSGVTVTIK